MTHRCRYCLAPATHTYRRARGRLRRVLRLPASALRVCSACDPHRGQLP